MNAIHPSIPRSAPRAGRNSLQALLAALLCLVLTGCLGVDRQSEALRDQLLEAAGCEPDQQFELGLGFLPLALARAGLSFVEMETDARAAMSSVREVEVGVYKLRPGKSPMNRAALLAAADQVMERQNWYRLAGVLDHNEMVAVYTPNSTHFKKKLKIRVVVVNPREMVLVSAAGNPEPLLEIAFHHINASQESRPAVAQDAPVEPW